MKLLEPHIDRFKRWKVRLSMSFILLFGSFLAPELNGQDTLRVMHYNLLYYGTTTAFCTDPNNDVAEKADLMATIASHVHPDLITVNEIAANETTADHFLKNALNTKGNEYDRPPLRNPSNTSIDNMLFYRKKKLGFSRQFNTEGRVRDVDIYELYHRASGDPGADTTFLTVCILHLKAGQDASDAEKRAATTDTLMALLDSLPYRGRRILTGDMNFQGSHEKAYKNLVEPQTPALSFSDPTQMEGEWHDAPGFASLHTQSTHIAKTGCKASGGLDDRFDLIMLDGSGTDGHKGISYLAGSYKVLGQDGQRLNGSVVSPSNQSIPNTVGDALFDMSDHLPVILRLRVGSSNPVNEDARESSITVVSEGSSRNRLRIRLRGKFSQNRHTLRLFSIQGRLLRKKELSPGRSRLELSVKKLAPGFYFLEVRGENAGRVIKELSIPSTSF